MGLQGRCDGCLDMVLRSLLQVFNPAVEAGAGRLVVRHRYTDGFMPDYRRPAANRDGRNVYGDRGDWADNDDDGNRGPRRPVRTRTTAAANGPTTTAANDDDQTLTDFVVDLLKTIKLTSRAELKKSRNKLTTSRVATSVSPYAHRRYVVDATTTERQSGSSFASPSPQ